MDRPETMTAFLDLLQDKYGGAEMYVKRYMQLGEEDVIVIKRNLIRDDETSVKEQNGEGGRR